MEIICEMAETVEDAIIHCAGNGRQFIKHFLVACNEKPGSDCFGHHCGEMQGWWKASERIVMKHNNKPIRDDKLQDWFFTAGSNLETMIGDEGLICIYQELCDGLLDDRKSADVETLLTDILKKHGRT